MKKLTEKHTIRACYAGYVTQAVINNLPPLLFLIFQAQFGLPLSKITLLITVNFAIQLGVDLLCARFADSFGYRPLIVAAHAFCALGLLGMASLPFLLPDAYAGLLCAVALNAFGGGMLEVLVSPIVEACNTERKAAAMSLLHSFYCWGTVAVIVLSTGFLFAFGKKSWRFLCAVWALLPVINALVFARVPIGRLTKGDEGMRLGELLKDGTFWIFALLMVTAGASEQAMSQWASCFAERGLGVGKAVGDLAGPCFFSVLMGCARVLYAKLERRLNLPAALTASGVLCVAAYTLAALSPHPALSLLGCGLCGFSVGVLWPGVFSMASAHFARGGTALFALLALGGDLGCSGGPTLVGLVAGTFGDELRAGLLAALLFPLALLALCALYQKRRAHPAAKP